MSFDRLPSFPERAHDDGRGRPGEGGSWSGWEQLGLVGAGFVLIVACFLGFVFLATMIENEPMPDPTATPAAQQNP